MKISRLILKCAVVVTVHIKGFYYIIRMKLWDFYLELFPRIKEKEQLEADLFIQFVFNSAYYSLLHEKLLAEQDSMPKTANNFYEHRLKEVGRTSKELKKAALKLRTNTEIVNAMFEGMRDGLLEQIDHDLKRLDELTEKNKHRIASIRHSACPVIEE